MKKFLSLTAAGIGLALLVPTTFAAPRHMVKQEASGFTRPTGEHISRRMLWSNVSSSRAPLIHRGTRGVERKAQSSSASSSSASSVKSSAASSASSSASSK